MGYVRAFKFISLFVCCALILQPTQVGILDKLSSVNIATATVISFLLGSLCSAAAGYIGLWVSIHTNVRVSSAACRSYLEAVQVKRNQIAVYCMIWNVIVVLASCRWLSTGVPLLL